MRVESGCAVNEACVAKIQTPERTMKDNEYNQMLTVLRGAGLISKKTGIQKNTESTPDEESRIESEENTSRSTVVDASSVETIIEQQPLDTKNMTV